MTEKQPLIEIPDTPVEPFVVTERKYQDKCCIFFFIIYMIIAAVIAVMTVTLSADAVERMHEIVERESEGQFSYAYNLFNDLLPLSIGALLLSGLISVTWFKCLVKHPVGVLYSTLWFTVFMMVFGGAACNYVGSVMDLPISEDGETDVARDLRSTGLAVAFVGLVLPCVFLGCADRFALAGKVVSVSTDIVDSNRATLFYSAVGSTLQAPIALGSIWLVYRSILIGEWNEDPEVPVDEQFEGTPLGGVLVLYHMTNMLILSFLGWYIVSATVAGVVGTSWWHGNSKTAARESFVRATTTSLGSLVYCAFVMAIATMIKAIMESGKEKQDRLRADPEPLPKIFLSCLGEFFYQALQFLTKYAVIFVALKGDNLCESSKSAFYMVKRNPLNTIFVDEVIESVFISFKLFFSAGIALVVGGVAYLRLPDQAPDFVKPEVTLGVLAAFTVTCWVLSMLVIGVGTNVVTSAGQAVYCCYSIDKDNGLEKDPKISTLYEEVNSNAPFEADEDRSGPGLDLTEDGYAPKPNAPKGQAAPPPPPA